ncbi:hypothetical protein MRBBS_3237 [Marinobacter sp. BSs20148]|nr:hypothetical protein MRBBS_3237 [Marinobacter sp. BSs20148]
MGRIQIVVSGCNYAGKDLLAYPLPDYAEHRAYVWAVV